MKPQNGKPLSRANMGRLPSSFAWIEDSDHSTVSDWAVEAFQWAIEVGIINSKNGKLVPQGQATRAEVAAILHRYIIAPRKEP
jgi:hypothetical protein